MTKNVKLNQRRDRNTPSTGRPVRLQPRFGQPSWRPPSGSVAVDAEPWLPPFRVERGDREEWLRRYREWISVRPELIEKARRDLGGRHLLCMCGEGMPCHGDLLLEIANEPIRKDQS